MIFKICVKSRPIVLERIKSTIRTSSPAKLLHIPGNHEDFKMSAWMEIFNDPKWR